VAGEGEKSNPLLLTTTLTVPEAVDEGATQNTSVGLTNPADTVEAAPNLHLRFLENSKPAPVIVTLVPPLIGPNEGETELTEATPVNVKGTPDPDVKSSPLRLTSKEVVPWTIEGVSHSILV
jgi:hypothetical protein